MPTPPGADPLIGQVIDGYRILGVLGRGGMGIVYKAEDEALSRFVALKMIDPGFARDEVFARRFRAEARALARLDSEHIVDVYTMRQTEAGSFIVMEYVDGYTVADRIQEGRPMAWEEALSIIKQTLKALAHAHRLGVIHRDIKPSNIMLTRAGKVKVTDFGLAKLRQADKDATVTQGVSGTLFYMSPEQVKGEADLDHRSDLYSLGMTIYQMVAGELPLDRESGQYALMKTIIEEPFDPPSIYRDELTPAWDKVIMVALEKDPARRYQRAQEMLEAVQGLEAPPPPQAEAATQEMTLAGGESGLEAQPEPVPVEKKSRAAYLVGAVAAVGLLAVLGYFVLPGFLGSEAPEAPVQDEPLASVATPQAEDTSARAVGGEDAEPLAEARPSEDRTPQDEPTPPPTEAPVEQPVRDELGTEDETPEPQPAADTPASVPPVITDLLGIQQGPLLRSRLDQLQAAGQLAYGRRENFSNPEQCYVFVVNRRTERVVAVFAPGDGARVNLLTGETETDAQRTRRRAFLGIWVAVATGAE